MKGLYRDPVVMLGVQPFEESPAALSHLRLFLSHIQGLSHCHSSPALSGSGLKPLESLP